jgi:2-phospho-L-lactate guanylyltransferase
MPIVFLPADLPAIRPGELDTALHRAGTDRQAVLADLDGVGTTLLTQPTRRHQPPRFERNSHMAHVAGGAKSLRHPSLLGIRRDVDTIADLNVAQTIGLGARTRPLAADLIIPKSGGSTRPWAQ